MSTTPVLTPSAAAAPILVTRERIVEIITPAVAGKWLYGIDHQQLEHGRDWRWLNGAGGGFRYTLPGLRVVAVWLRRVGEIRAADALEAAVAELELHARAHVQPAAPARASEQQSWSASWEQRQEEIRS